MMLSGLIFFHVAYRSKLKLYCHAPDRLMTYDSLFLRCIPFVSMLSGSYLVQSNHNGSNTVLFSENQFL